jgi:hypothetical protein
MPVGSIFLTQQYLCTLLIFISGHLELCTILPAQTKYEFQLCNPSICTRLEQLVNVAFEALAAVVMNSAVFWNIASCALQKSIHVSEESHLSSH